MVSLTNSTTVVQKATYVPLNIVQTGGYIGRAALKFGYIRQLNLQPGEVDAVRNILPGATSAARGQGLADANFWSILQQFEGTPLVSQLPSPSIFANFAEADLIAFGNGLTTVRKQAVLRLQQETAAPPAASPGGAAQTPTGSRALSVAQNYLNTSSVATNAFTANTSTSNMGMLNLERLEMTPDGVERGALLATIPLAPKERTAVVQQEWSVTSQEFTSIVTDSLENYSQTGVTENTQLAQSTTSQVAHSNQFNVTSSVQGGIKLISGSVSASFGGQDQSSQSANDSRQHAIQTTRQASSRVRQSHKVTISTSTVTGASQTSTRMFENPSATDPMRVDYFSLMRKWYVALYRYGLRLTYDITIPEPGGTLREIYAQLAELQTQASGAFSFNLQYADITPDDATVERLSQQYGVQLPTPPAPTQLLTIGGTQVQGIDPNHLDTVVFWPLTVNVPDGYEITNILLTGDLDGGGYLMDVIGWSFVSGREITDSQDGEFPNVTLTGFLQGATGSQTITSRFRSASTALVTYFVTCAPTDATMEQWKSNVWGACYNAAQTAFYANQQLVNARIQTLQNQIANVDTLTLRREENDEIMKGVLRWLLGPNFEFMPSKLVNDLIQANLTNLAAIFNGVNFTGNAVNFLNPAVDWSLMSWDQARVNFINQAIDWSSVIYFLYSYFWDIPTSWDFIRQIQHPDSSRQAFLRAGSARVVLTVRKGWETAWTYFWESGEIPPPEPLAAGGDPYLTIAHQIADYDNTNYPGIPPANPNGGGPIDDDTPQIGTTCDSDLPAGATSIPVASSSGFVAGATAIIDAWNATDNSGNAIQETQTITAVPDGTHITVQGLLHPHSAASGPFPVVQASAKGLLIGEWYEYTPTSGTDIAIATPSTTTYCDNGQFGDY